ncbi:MAG: hypothetical protein EBU70_15475, partial [Actinobacteria bacterium]|nr:hypothetical protein [Actinomycetota bacterium]
MQVRVFDFGAVSITYRIPFDGPASAMLELSLGLSNHPALLADGRARAEALLHALVLASSGAAVRKPAVSAFIEDYVVFAVDRVEGAAAAGPLAARQSRTSCSPSGPASARRMPATVDSPIEASGPAAAAPSTRS